MDAEPLSYPDEVWKPVTDPRITEPLEVSNFARVRRLGRAYWTVTKTQGGFWRQRPARIAQQAMKLGYPNVSVRRENGKYRAMAVHIIVCWAFHGPPPTPAHEVAHWEHGRTNARPENLRWATSKENVADFARHGVKRIGTALPQAILTPDTVREARAMHAVGRRRSVIARQLNVNWSTIDRMLKGETWGHVT